METSYEVELIDSKDIDIGIDKVDDKANEINYARNTALKTCN